MESQSEKSKSNIKSYQDLQVWERSSKLALEVYKLSGNVKKAYSAWEIWKQVIRSSFSAPANITEGFYSHRGKNFVSHLEIARGSLGETDYWLVVLFEIGQIKKEDSERLRRECQEIIAMITSLIRKIKA